MRPRTRWAVWIALLAGVTLGLVAFRGHLDKAHLALVYLLVVLGGSVQGGRRLGLTLASLAFLLFNWFFLPPYGTFYIADPLDWLVLVAFLVVATVAAQMLHRLQREAEEARRRAEEVDRLAALGAETLSVARADQALSRISATIRETLGVTECRLHTAAAFEDGVAEDLAAWVARHGRAAMRLDDGTTRLSDSADPLVVGREIRALFLPLRVRGGTVGVLEIADARPFGLDAAQRRFLTALSYYAALAIERVRLSTEADHVEALREADRLKDALLASVSHDLRTPLTTIKAHAHALASLGDDRAMAIEEEADRLGRLVADLLELSRLQAGALPVVLELNAVDDLIGAALQRASGALQGHEVRVAMENGGTLLVGRFDFVHTLRILVNLLENAAKYAAPRTPIDLTVRRMGEVLAIAVADRGHGIPESEQARIFEPFYRPPGAAPDVAGVGLGLSIARRLAEAQDGTLEHSPREGGGSVFTLRLRAADLPHPAHSELEGEL